MRLLHTSDWHLGRSLHRADLSAGHEAFCEHLVEVVRSEQVDLVAVAGDVFDRAIPPLAAIALFEDTLLRLRATGARVVVTSGNHDSAGRLGVNSRLLDDSGVHIRTRVEGLADPVIIEDTHGPVAVYAIPYLEPETVRGRLPGDEVLGTGHAAVLGQATAAARTDLATRGVPRSVAIAHGWVAGGELSDSERDITVGGVGAVPAALFQGFSYTALGHLHRPQQVADALHYCGSPLPFSFSEAGQDKHSLLVTLDAAGLASVEPVPAPVFRRLSVVRGLLADVLRGHDDQAEHFVSVTLTDAVVPAGAMEHLRTRFPYVLRLGHEPATGDLSTATYTSRVRGRSDLEITSGFVDHVRGVPATESETALLTSALEAGHRAEIDVEQVA
ncbi:MAG TPA: exonuclease SbcCD subunit D C-terminal domain-containing protein [Mycobacteriales bacterium]